jgi:hypothetical protein
VRCKASRGARRLPPPTAHLASAPPPARAPPTARPPSPCCGSASAGTGAADSTPPLALLRQGAAARAAARALGRGGANTAPSRRTRQARRGAEAVDEALRRARYLGCGAEERCCRGWRRWQARGRRATSRARCHSCPPAAPPLAALLMCLCFVGVVAWRYGTHPQHPPVSLGALARLPLQAHACNAMPHTRRRSFGDGMKRRTRREGKAAGPVAATLELLSLKRET